MNPASEASHERYAQKHSLPFPLLADTQRAAAHAYDALKPNGKNIQRTVLIIDREGVIRYVKQGMPKDSELLAALREMES